MPTVAQFDFEDSTEGWLPDSIECPDAVLETSKDQAQDGESALKWTLPASISGRCTVEVNVENVVGEPDSVVVGCWVWIPEGLQSDSSAGSAPPEFGLWLYDDSFRSAFSPNELATDEIEDWVWIEMDPSQEYGVPGEQPDSFGHLKVVRVWYKTNSELQPKEPIFIDSCQIGTPAGPRV